MVVLSFFDDRIATEIKAQMAQNLHLPPSVNSVKRLQHPPDPLSPMTLAQCVTKRTAIIFDVLWSNGGEKAASFLAKDPEEWNDDPSYTALKKAASSMRVVNDAAERGIALI